MNLMKNCMEASESGTTVHCSYGQNPLYVQIRIWDEGQGFKKEDLPHLFERFYRGKGSKDTGIGIGLSLSKAIIEMQNGIIRASNLSEGGACFEICFYSHKMSFSFVIIKMPLVGNAKPYRGIPIKR